MKNSDDLPFATAMQRDNLWEYLVAVFPGEALTREIITEEEDFYSGFETIAEKGNRPHIPLIGFLAKEAMEETLSRWISNICRLHPGFTAMLNNFSAVPETSLFLRVADPAPFTRLVQRLGLLDEFIRSNDCPPLSAATIIQLPFGSRLHPQSYEKAVAVCSKKTFSASFPVEKTGLMKRSFPGEPFRLVNSFVLAAPVPVEQ
jgi:hypothetical protein